MLVTTEKLRKLQLVLAALSQAKTALNWYSGYQAGILPGSRHFHSCPELRVDFAAGASGIQIVRLDWHPAGLVHESVDHYEAEHCVSLWFEPNAIIANLQCDCNFTEFSDAELSAFGLDLSGLTATLTDDPARLNPGFVAAYVRLLASALAALLQQRCRDLDDREMRVFFARKVRNIITMHYGDPDLRLDDIARMLRVSTNYLSEHFRKETGRSVYQELLELRLERSKKLLADAKLGIKTVAVRCGFSRSGYFATAFHHRWGITPSQYRQQLSANRNSQTK